MGGAWEFIAEEGGMLPNQWLQSFVITGRLCSSGDWSECYLSYRESDNAVMLQGGVLSLEEESGCSILTRHGQSGQDVRFRLFNLPPPVHLARLQGIWDNGDFPPIHIMGCLWECGSRKGILKLRCMDGCLLLGEVKASLEEDDAVLSCSGHTRTARFDRRIGFERSA